MPGVPSRAARKLHVRHLCECNSVSPWQQACHYAPLHLQAVKDAWDVFRPGGQLHPQYFLEHKWNFIFEGILLVVIAYMFLQRSGPKKKQDRPLSEKVGTFGTW